MQKRREDAEAKKPEGKCDRPLGTTWNCGTAMLPLLSSLGCLLQCYASDKQQTLPGAVITHPTTCRDTPS